MNRFSRTVVVSGIIVCSLGYITYAAAKGRKDEWRITTIKDSMVIFRNGKQLNTSLRNVQLLAKIDFRPGSPLFVFAGNDCSDSSARKAIFLFSPGEKEKKIVPEYAPYDFPGKELSAIDGSLLYESRMFIGHVLPNIPDGIIWYQTMLTDHGVYEKSVYIISIHNGKLSERFEFEHLPPIYESLQLLKTGKCREIKGEDYIADDMMEE